MYEHNQGYIVLTRSVYLQYTFCQYANNYTHCTVLTHINAGIIFTFSIDTLRDNYRKQKCDNGRALRNLNV